MHIHFAHTLLLAFAFIELGTSLPGAKLDYALTTLAPRLLPQKRKADVVSITCDSTICSAFDVSSVFLTTFDPALLTSTTSCQGTSCPPFTFPTSGPSGVTTGTGGPSPTDSSSSRGPFTNDTSSAQTTSGPTAGSGVSSSGSGAPSTTDSSSSRGSAANDTSSAQTTPSPSGGSVTSSSGAGAPSTTGSSSPGGPSANDTTSAQTTPGPTAGPSSTNSSTSGGPFTNDTTSAQTTSGPSGGSLTSSSGTGSPSTTDSSSSQGPFANDTSSAQTTAGPTAGSGTSSINNSTTQLTSTMTLSVTTNTNSSLWSAWTAWPTVTSTPGNATNSSATYLPDSPSNTQSISYKETATYVFANTTMVIPIPASFPSAWPSANQSNSTDPTNTITTSAAGRPSVSSTCWQNIDTVSDTANPTGGSVAKTSSRCWTVSCDASSSCTDTLTIYPVVTSTLNGSIADSTRGPPVYPGDPTTSINNTSGTTSSGLSPTSTSTQLSTTSDTSSTPLVSTTTGGSSSSSSIPTSSTLSSSTDAAQTTSSSPTSPSTLSATSSGADPSSTTSSGTSSSMAVTSEGTRSSTTSSVDSSAASSTSSTSSTSDTTNTSSTSSTSSESTTTSAANAARQPGPFTSTSVATTSANNENPLESSSATTTAGLPDPASESYAFGIYPSDNNGNSFEPANMRSKNKRAAIKARLAEVEHEKYDVPRPEQKYDSLLEKRSLERNQAGDDGSLCCRGAVHCFLVGGTRC